MSKRNETFFRWDLLFNKYHDALKKSFVMKCFIVRCNTLSWVFNIIEVYEYVLW